MANKTKIESLIFVVVATLVNTPLGLCRLARDADDKRHQAVLRSTFSELVCGRTVYKYLSYTVSPRV